MKKCFKCISNEADPYKADERFFQVHQWLKNNDKFIQAMLEGMRSREALTRFVVSFPDEVEARLPKIAAVYKLAPPIIWQAIMRAIRVVAKENPLEGGRPDVMRNIEAKLEICREILQLFGDGVSLGESQKGIARRHRISVRKVQRIWKERQKLNSAEPRTVSDLVNALSNLAKGATEH